MNEAEHDELALNSAEQGLPEDGEAPPMEGLLAELLGSWQEEAVAAEPAEEPAMAEATAEEVLPLMQWLVDDSAESLEQPAQAVVAHAAPEPEAGLVPVPFDQPDAAPAVEAAPFPEQDAAPVEQAAAPVEQPTKEPEPIQPREPALDDGALRRLLGLMREEMEASEPARPPLRSGGPERGLERFLTFRLAEESFALPLLKVQETDRLPKATRVPGLPRYVRGVANLRGTILPLVDLRQLLHLEEADSRQDGRILVVKPAADDSPVALVVDALQGIAMLARKELHRTPQWLESRMAPYIEGIGNHKGWLISVLDLDKIFAAAELGETPAGGTVVGREC
jgi:purine-binding chemotaxis protein CheW